MSSNRGTRPPTQAARIALVVRECGYHQACFSLEDDASLASVELTWKRDEPQRWINPMGLSGRDNVLLDSTGVKLQWLEWHA